MAVLHPLIDARPCDLCLEYEFNEKTGKPRRDSKGNLERRPRNGKPPCRTPRGCPKGTPENSRELTPANRKAYEHYLECKATGQFPDDPLVRRNASIIMQAEREAEQAQQIQLLAARVIRETRSRPRGAH